MGRIQNYSKDTEVTANDKWVGSDFENYGSTKNFTPTSIAKYLNDNNVINIGSDLRYRYQTLNPGEVRNIGTLSFESEIGASVLFSSITTFLLSKRSLKQNDVSQYLQFLNGGSIIINSADNQNLFGFYKVIGLSEYTTDTNFYVVTLEYIDGNGSIVEDTDYIFSLITDKYSDTEQVNSDWNSISGVSEILNKPIIPSIAGLATESYVNSQDDLKVDKVAGKGLSTNDYTTLEKDKLADIASGAEVNVNADWNATSGDALILNKPTIPSLSGYVPYTGATSDVNLGSHSLTSDELILNTSPTKILTAPGQMIWNDVDGTLDVRLKGNNVTLQVGQENVVRIVNKTGGDLLESNYQAVRVRLVSEGGAAGQRLAVVLAQANNDPNSATTIGLVTENINNNQEGFITTNGQVKEINTTGILQGETWVDGDMLYLSGTTAGRLTNIKPAAPTHTIVIGYVEYAHAVHGKIFVKVDNGYELDELHNVSISGVANNDLIQYDSALNLWKNKSLSAAGIQPTLPSLTSGSVLFSNGTTIAQDNASFFWDNTNKSLKLSAALSSNTEAPLVVKNLTAYSAPNYNQYAQLWKNSTDTVIGYFRADGRLYTSNSVNTNYFTGNVAGSNAAPVLSAATGYGVLFPGLNSVAISTASAERLRINNIGNVLIGTTTDIPSSKLTVESTTQGFLAPRMNTAQKNAISSPATGLLVYDTDLLSLYQYNGTAWTAVGGASTPNLNSVLTVGNSSLLDANIGQLGLYDTSGSGYSTILANGQTLYFNDYNGDPILRAEPRNITIFESPTIEATLRTSLLTATRLYQLPDAAGTIALTSDIPAAITLTTTGTSGPSTLVGSTLNIPQYSGGGGSGFVGIHSLIPLVSGAITSSAIIANANGTGGNFTANRVIAYPFIPAQSFTSLNIQMGVSGAAAGSLCRIAIYDDLSGTPGNTIFVSSDLDLSTTGVKTAVVSVSFIAGTTYWLAFHGGSVVTSVNLLPIGQMVPLKTLSVNTAANYVYRTATFGGGTPSAFGAATYAGGNIPLILITKA